MLNEQYRSGLADRAPAGAAASVVEGAQQSLVAALGMAPHPRFRGRDLADAAREAFTSGAADAFSLATGLLCLTALLLGLLIPGRSEPKSGVAQHDELVPSVDVLPR